MPRFRILAVGVLAVTIAAQAQQTPPPPTQPTFRTEANYIRVDAYPTKDGAPVTDLTQDDFEVLEEGKPQKIEQFEHVTIRPAGPQETRIEPNNVREARMMAESPRARLFVVFLDTYHVDVSDSHRIRKPLVDALDKVIGQDDLVAVMTPEMSAADIVFARRTTTIDGFLARVWHWGERNRMQPVDAEDQEYAICYPTAVPGGKPDCSDQNGLAQLMLDRRHEKRALDALQDLVRYLGGVREERKAILAVTNGWLRYRPDQSLMRPLNKDCHPPPMGPAVGVGPGGRLTVGERPQTGLNYDMEQRCNRDRIYLGQLDNDRQFQLMLDEANRANASFYPIDPRGLAVFDTPIAAPDAGGGFQRPVPLTTDMAMLRARLEGLRTIAEATDGLAIVDSNDLARGLRRVVDDLSSYYLMGYYSGGKLDGRFHAIKVRVKRPGIQVRARRGYLAATPDAVNASRATAAAAKAPDAETLAIQAALTPLAETVRELPLRVHATAGWRPTAGGSPSAAFWVVSEQGPGAPPRDVDITVVNAAGATVARGTGTGARTVLVVLPATQPVEPGDYTVRVRGEAIGTGSVRVPLPAAPDAGGAVVLRRGLSTGNREVPTADLRFRRGEQIRIQVPALEGGAVSARLLDRLGKHLTAIPVAAAVRDDPDGAHWLTANLALAPLAPSDYIIELTTRSGLPAVARSAEVGGSGGSGRSGRAGTEGAELTEKRVLVAFRVIQ